METKQTKNVWIGLIVIALLAGVYYFSTISKKSTENPQNTKTDSVVQTDTDQRSTDQKWQDLGYKVVEVGSDQVTEGTTTFSDSITDLGQKIAQGSMSIPHCCDYDRTTAGKFVRVDLKINNIGLNYNEPTLSFLEIIDQDGRHYNAGFDSAEVKEPLTPNIPKTVSLIYEVSKDSNSFTLKFYYK